MNRDRLALLLLPKDAIRHPFRQNLPARTLDIAREDRDSVSSARTRRARRGDDISLFALSFLAFFTAFYTFIF